MKHADLQAMSRIDLAARLSIFDGDVDSWTKEERIIAAGLSASQRVVLVDMIGVLKERQQSALEKLKQSVGVGAFGDATAAFILESTGAGELWRLFRFILEQGADARLKDPVRQAVRVAGDCYAHCILKARQWSAVDPQRLREAPLVYLDAIDSPATAGRGSKVQSLSLAVRQWRDVTLPLPFVLLPINFAGSIWTYCALHHETGHNLDQDLGMLSDLRGQLPETVPADREAQWRRWSGEILADALGIVLGGAGFATYLASEALLLGPAQRFQSLDPSAVHPPFLLRVPLLVAMLRASGVAGLSAAADQVEEAWNEVPQPAWLGPFLPTVPKVAELFLTGKLAVLKDHSVLELNPGLAADHAQVEALAKWMLTGKMRPPPDNADMSVRLVPAAAQLALRRMADPTPQALAALHDIAAGYADLIPSRAALAAGAAGRRDYLKALMRTQVFPGQSMGLSI